MKKILIVLSILLFSLEFAQKVHVVKEGDTPYGISRTYGLKLEGLYQLNPSLRERVLSIGEKLIVSGNPIVSASSKTTTPISKNGQIILLPNQSIWGITKQYNISEADLRKLNPDLDNNMKIGDKVTLPLSNIAKYGKDQPVVNQAGASSGNISTNVFNNPPVYTNSSEDKDYVMYTVQNGDTTFGILNKFNISLDELINLNPQLSSGLKPGMVLKIKKIISSYKKTISSNLNVVLMLPFGYDNNDSKYRDLSLEFTMGAKLAIERNAKFGKKLNVKIIDAGNEGTFKNSLSQVDLNATDLIIGPFFKQSLIEVLNYVKEKKIPVVAPFANSSDLHSYENLIIVETDDNVYAEKIAEEVVNVFTNEKIYIVANTDKQYATVIKNKIQQNLKNAVVEIVNSASLMKLDNNMMTGNAAPIIAVLADDKSEVGSIFANKLIEFSKLTDGIKAFSMFYSPSFDSKINELQAVNLVYLMDRKINPEGDFEKEILADYKSKYCITPTKYAVIGFDVVNDMLSRENDNGEIFKQITKSQTQLATKFDFVRVSESGAYANTGYRVVRLIQN